MYEAQRLLRRVADRDAECARWMVLAIEEMTAADANMPIKYALLHIHTTLPGVSLTERERKLLCHSQSESLTEEQPQLRFSASQSMLAL
jgi:hypothetical protein